MKPLPIIATSAIIALLFVAPVMAATSVTVSVAQPSYSGTAAVNVSGTVSPAPGPNQAVSLSFTTPSGQTVPIGTASLDPTTGAFSASFNTGGPYFSSSGTYTVTAAFGAASGQATFSYTASPTGGGGGGGGGGISQAQFNDIMGNLTAIKAQLTALQSAVTALQSSQTSMSGTLSTIQNSLTSLSGTLTGVSTTVNSISSSMASLSTQVANAASQAQNAATAVGTTQTYVLVVAVLAAITLVLELAILVRKLS